MFSLKTADPSTTAISLNAVKVKTEAKRYKSYQTVLEVYNASNRKFIEIAGKRRIFWHFWCNWPNWKAYYDSAALWRLFFVTVSNGSVNADSKCLAVSLNALSMFENALTTFQNDFEMVFNDFRFHWQTLPTFHNAMEMFFNAFSTIDNALKWKNGTTLFSLSLVFPNRVTYCDRLSWYTCFKIWQDVPPPLTKMYQDKISPIQFYYRRYCSRKQ